jgi:hypothetical protein
MSCSSGIYNANSALIAVLIVLVVVLGLERLLRTAGDEFEDADDWERPPHPHSFAREPAMP